MSTTTAREKSTRRETWGTRRKLPSGRWQARYPGPDGETYTARTDDDRSLTFLTKTDARTWLAAVQTKLARGTWEAPAAVAAWRKADAEAATAWTMGFEEYAEHWIDVIRTQPNRSGKRRAVATVQQHAGKVRGYLVPEIGDMPLREIDAARINVMTDRLDQIPSPLNPKLKFNGISRPTLMVLMMILRQAPREDIIDKSPAISIPKQPSIRHDSDHDPGEDVLSPKQVEQLYEATQDQYAIMILLAAWFQLRRGVCLGLQRCDIEWHDDGSATLHIRRQLNVYTGDYTDLKTEAGRRSLSVPRLMHHRLSQHLEEYVAPEAKAPIVPTSGRGNMTLSNTHWGYQWSEIRDAVQGFPHRFRFHDLRHTGLTIFAQEGATLAELMRRGGHADMHIVMRYQYATLSRDRELADRMSDRISGAAQASSPASASTPAEECTCQSSEDRTEEEPS